MLYAFLITLREGFETALIVTLVLGYLVKLGRRDAVAPVWWGVAAAALGALLVGVGVQVSTRELSGQALELFEGSAMLFAFGVLTWMVFWMRRQAASIGRELRAQVDVALRQGTGLALALLAASAVGREGLETVLFLLAGAPTAESGPAYVTGGVLGVAVAAALGYLVYRGAARLPIRTFFTVSGIAVIVLAAGLLTNGLAELQDAGLLTNLGPRPWDTDAWLPMTSTLGRFLNAITGYDSAPTLAQIVAYVAYLVAALGVFLLGRGPAHRPGPRRPATTRA